MFVATEASLFAPNYAAVFQAQNGLYNYAIYAQQGMSLLGEALINGRRYHGEAINNVSLLVDPSKYDVIEVYPDGDLCGLKFKTYPDSQPIQNGKQLTVINVNDLYGRFFLYDIIRAQSSWKLCLKNYLEKY